jgi:hypothetical protein
MKPFAQTLSLVIIGRIESLGTASIAPAQVVEIAADVQENFPKLRRPARRLVGVCHEPGMMVCRLE